LICPPFYRKIEREFTRLTSLSYPLGERLKSINIRKGSMSKDSNVNSNSFRWLLLAGSVAVALTIFLYRVDNHLTTSDKEARLGDTLRTLRTAQSEVSAGASDERQVVGALLEARSLNKDDHHSSSDAHH